MRETRQAQAAAAHGDDIVLNVAAVTVGTRALGPGTRSAVWVQGCPLHCAGCMAPDWIPDIPARPVTAGRLAAELLADPGVSGLTFSGGEPMAQAAGLAAVALAARRQRDVDIICFTGLTLKTLRSHPPNTGTGDLLAQVDTLIDGPYVAALDDGTGLRGSSNQSVHHLTDRLAGMNHLFTTAPRKAEVRITDREVFVVGLPPAGLLTALDGVDFHGAHSAGRGPSQAPDSGGDD